jgi:hypothetical protein
MIGDHKSCGRKKKQNTLESLDNVKVRVKAEIKTYKLYVMRERLKKNNGEMPLNQQMMNELEEWNHNHELREKNSQVMNKKGRTRKTSHKRLKAKGKSVSTLLNENQERERERERNLSYSIR